MVHEREAPSEILSIPASGIKASNEISILKKGPRVDVKETGSKPQTVPSREEVDESKIACPM